MGFTKDTTMLGFDPRSFIIIAAALGILCALVFAVLRRSFPVGIKGLKEWALACSVMTIAALLFSLRGSVHVAFSSYVANILLVGGIMLMYAGLREFAGHPSHRQALTLCLAVLSFGLIGPTLLDDDYRLRLVLISAANTTLFGLCALTIYRLPAKQFPEWFTGALFLFTASVSLTRLLAALFNPPRNDPFSDVSFLQHIYLGTFSFGVVALSVGFILMVNYRLRSMLEHAASHDDMTGARRRSAFLELLEGELGTIRQGNTTSLLMIDIDDFKEINDRLGHVAGDRVIVDYAQKAQRELRRADVLGRYGGEEFVVLLPGTTAQQAHAIANRLRLTAHHPASGDVAQYTVSIGVATSTDGLESPMNLIARADEALYEAKHAGKDRIAIAKEPHSSVTVLRTRLTGA
jgi:diguanylate cyclase (GGDEF)-like protein